MKKVGLILLGILVICFVIYGLYRFVSEGVEAFSSKSIQGIIFFVGVLIYFIYTGIRDYRKDIKKKELEK